MANFIDRFLNSMKLYDDEDEYDEEDDEMEEREEPAPKRSFRSKTQAPREERTAPVRQSAPPEKAERAPRASASRRPTRDNIVPMKSTAGMEVCMVKPSALDDAREICDILLSGRAVVINMEGVHVDLAQRIVDFTSGSCYSINGNLQKISKYIFIVTPQSIGLSGDFADVIEGSQDLSTLSLNT